MGEELEDMVRQAEQKGTVRQTKWAVKKFEDWMTKRKVEVNVREAGSATSSGILKRFYGEVRGVQGSDLSASTLVGIRAGLQRHPLGMKSGVRDEQLVQVYSCSVARTPTASSISTSVTRPRSRSVQLPARDLHVLARTSTSRFR